MQGLYTDQGSASNVTSSFISLQKLIRLIDHHHIILTSSSHHPHIILTSSSHHPHTILTSSSHHPQLHGDIFVAVLWISSILLKLSTRGMKWTNRLIITLCYSYGFFLNSHASVYNKEMLGGLSGTKWAVIQQQTVKSRCNNRTQEAAIPCLSIRWISYLGCNGEWLIYRKLPLCNQKLFQKVHGKWSVCHYRQFGHLRHRSWLSKHVFMIHVRAHQRTKFELWCDKIIWKLCYRHDYSND